ncbi:Oxygen-regulated protein 1 [Triplophysa tibetana]|uniref:Oxygen-regulated protein 1 n=1 Tax=Triplophysa tibetana TaxID=1572043 RepID=A0A5A9PE87_9TELE|nr:Oxygen-regulated protein 1 [Triplophysa tibetana]
MSTVPFNDVSPESMRTLVSRHLLLNSDPTTSKRVCFYKSGDPQFTGHRMVINSRTFKTFDALLDALSKKVPLSFGVRTITTPKGTHAVRTIDDLQDGASYLCSDLRKVKPFNLDEVHKTQVPWNSTRPVISGHQARRALVRQLVKRGEGTTRAIKMPENSVVVRTPKRLTVYKNKDPSIRRVIVLQRKTAPNFEALMDYLSKVMQFHVLKLYTEDGRKVDGLPALILCSGIVVAAGNEPFRMGTHNPQAPTKTIRSNKSEYLGPTQAKKLLEEKNKPSAPISRSRNFSLSSERYLVEQINKSLNGSLSEHNCQKTESIETEDSQPKGLEENCDSMASLEKRNHPIMPTEDDIEKSFRVNEDGSMTVEMKVHLTIKQEEMVHWTTTLSRSPVNNQQRAVDTSKPGSGMNSLDIADDSGKESNGPHSLECKEMNTLNDKSVGFVEEEREIYDEAVSQTSEKLKPIYRRLPTPGHRQQRKETSISETEVQESTVGAYSYMERTGHGELMEGYCVVSHSSSTRDLSKPRKSESGEIEQKSSHSFRSSGVAEVLQLKNNGTVGITEAVLHIYESQGMCDNYYANTLVDVENKPEYCTKALPRSRPGSTDSGPRSSSNDCDVDLTSQSTSSKSGDGGRNDMLSLSSASSTPSKTISNNPQILSGNAPLASGETASTENRMLQPIDEDYNDMRIIRNKNTNTPKSNKSKQSTSQPSGLGKRIKDIPSSSKGLQTTNNSDTLSHTESEKKTQGSAERAKHNNGRDQNKKTKTFEGTPKSRSLNLKRSSEKEQKSKTIKDISHKVNTNDTLKSNVLDNRSPAHPAPLKKMLRSMNGTKSKASTQKQNLSESVSLPVLQSSPSNVNQYVENWLQKIQADSLPYDDDIEHVESVPRAVFQIGSESADGSENKSEPEKDSVVDEELSIEHNAAEGPSLEHDAVERPAPVQIRCEGEPLEAQRLRGFCKSMPSVRVPPAEQESHVRMHKSSENLAPPDSCTEASTSQSTDVNTGSGVKPVLTQLCLSIQSIRRASSQTHLAPTVMEKSSSLPDFSSQVASAFGSPTRAFLSFLSLMTLRDGKSILSKDESQTSSSEAIQVMQSLEKISNIKDEEELKASLTSLQSSTSSRLKQSWRDFQERNLFGESPPMSPRQSEQEFALDVDSGEEGEEKDEEHDFAIEQLMDELNMSGDLRQEISSLIEGDLKSQLNLNNGENHENEDGSGNGSLEKAADMEMEKDHREENVGLENDTTKDEINDDPKEQESQEQHVIQSHSPDLETVGHDLVNKDSDIARPTPEEAPEDNYSNSNKAEVLETADNNQINTGTEIVIYGDSESRDVEQSHFQTSQQNFSDIAGADHSDKQNNISEGENNITADIKDGGGNKEEEATILPDDNTDDISKQKVTDLARDEQFSDDQGILSERDNNKKPYNREVREPNEEQDTIQSIKEHSEQSDVSEPDIADVTSEQKVTDLTGDEQFEYSDDQDIVSERENNMTPDDLEEREANEERDSIQSIKEYSEHSDVSEPDVTDATSEQKVTDSARNEQLELSDDQENVCEGDNKTTPDDMEERDKLQNSREHSEQSDFSEPDDLCLASETKCVEFPDKETEPNEDNESQFSTGEIRVPDCVREETDHSDFEEGGGDEEWMQEEENKSTLAECDVESQNSQHTLSHHWDAQSKHTVDVYESGSQDDEVMSPDVEHAMPEMSESEDLSCPERCNNVENSKTEYDETQQIDDSFVEGRKRDNEDHEISEHCKWVDPDAEAGSSRNSEPEVKNVTAETSRSSMSDSEHVCRTLEEDSHTDKNETPAELCDQEYQMPDFPQHSFIFKDDINNFAERKSCSSMKTNSSEEKFENLGMEHGYHYLLRPTEISQELLDLINSALLSSTLTVKYDSNGNLKIEPDKRKIREMFRAQHSVDDQYGQKNLPSPYTSDLSDYRPETSNNSGLQSQASMELLTESDDEEKRLRIFKEVLKQSSENPQNLTMDSSSVKSSPISSLNSNNSLNLSQDNKSVLHEPHYNRQTSHHRNSEQCMTISGDVDSEEGVLIDKGRWLLKENHLIRKSPPMPMGMYGNGETTSTDTGLDNVSEDAPYPHYENQAPLAVISSSDLEDLAKPCTPKCMYFNVPHSSGSDLLSDAQSLGGGSSRRNKELKVSPMGESSKMWAKKNGSLSSFASVEFKLADGKVHPQNGPVNTKTSHSIDSRTMQEEETRVGLNLRCGQHCPIL